MKSGDETNARQTACCYYVLIASFPGSPRTRMKYVRRFKASNGQPPGVGFGSGTESSHAYFSTFLYDSNIIYTLSYTDY